MFRTARRRLVAWNVLVLSLILLALGVTVYEYFQANIYNEVDQQLVSQQFRIVDYLRNHYYFILSLQNMGADPSGATYTTVVADKNLQVIVPQCATSAGILTQCAAAQPASIPSMEAVLRQWRQLSEHRLGQRPLPPTGISDVRTQPDKPVRVRTFALLITGSYGGLYVVQISRSVDPERSLLGVMRTLLTYGSLLGIVLAGIGSLFLANRALVPIRQAFVRQRQFTADASHELRTPLALIRANAEMLERYADRLPERDSDLVNEIIHETDHLNRLVGDLLTLARADTGSLKLLHKPVDLRALVSQVHDDVHLIAESRGIRSDLSLDGPVRVEGDEVRLRQLMLILLDNAMKYTDSGGRVHMSLEYADGRARLVVSDTGIGIPPKDLPHIFERFYRVDTAREHESGGTGLGLAIAEWIVQAHHGTIKVESAPQKGTRFQVDLPTSPN